MLRQVIERGFECELDGEVIPCTDDTSDSLLVVKNLTIYQMVLIPLQ